MSQTINNPEPMSEPATAQGGNRRVLIIDDNPEIHLDFGKILSPVSAKADEMARMKAALFGGPKSGATMVTSFKVDYAHQGEEGFTKVKAALAQGNPYALAFVDMRMPPGWDGLRTIKEIWSVDPELNIVVCTAYSDHSWSEIDALARETDRLLVLKKPFESIEVKRLAATLSAKWSLSRKAALKMGELEVLIQERTAELEAARQRDRMRMDELETVVQRRTAELRQRATHDVLTGLPNRALLHDDLVKALDRAKREPGYRMAVLFIDFDRFKVVNDSLGHEAGDHLLRGIAERLKRVLRSDDTLTLMETETTTAARLGGDEFCVLLSGLKRDEDAAIVADRILAELQHPYRIGDREVLSTASIGIAISSIGYERAEDLVRDADNAMYRAKAGGRDRYVIFDHTMHDEAMQRLTIESDLRRAVERDELRVMYQPIVSIDTGQVVGSEALVRWQHPQRGLIGPGEFVPIAEEIGIISQVGEWVLMESCRQLVAWQKMLPRAKALSVSVNVSGLQLADNLFARKVEQILAVTGINPADLVLEVTETAIVADVEAAAAMLQDLRDIGVRVSLDDFGTGHSSLSLLRQLPLTGLKIDQSFVRDAGGHRQYAAIVSAIISLVHNLNIDVVAEGVETLEQIALLQALGCAKGQGYLFSRPVKAADFEQFVTQNDRRWCEVQATAVA